MSGPVTSPSPNERTFLVVAATSDTGPGVRGVKSAARAVELLELLATRQNRPARLRELSDALGAPRSSVYALIKTLEEQGWVRSDPSGSLYSIGIRALLAGTTYLDTDPYLRIAQPHINELGVQLDETIHFGRLDRTDIVYLATKESTRYLRPFSRVGRRLPAYSTSLGKALLAERLDGDFEAHIPRPLTALTPNTLTSEKKLVADLQATRERGYARDNEENYEGVVCFGLALRYHQTPIDAISCSIPLRNLTDDRQVELIDGLERTRLAIEQMAPAEEIASAAWA
jgi:DNA-binding IclR family transcriptional regulator